MIIATEGLTKRFGRLTAVDGIDLRVREGDLYGFLGPNGSGKTTTVRMLLGLVFASRGEIQVLGHDVPRHARRALPHVGALVEGPAAYAHLSARANLALLDAAGPRAGWRVRRSRRARIDEALERVGLAGVRRQPVGTFSLGMKQRLGLAAALVRAPRLLVLDEPTNGLDPRGIRDVRDLLLDLNRAGTTIFLSSHQLAEVEQTCTHVGVLDAGRLVLQTDLAALRAPTGRVVVASPDADRVAALLDGRVEQRAGDHLLVREPDPAALTRTLVEAGLRVAEVVPERRTLEDVVLDITGAGADRVDERPAGEPRVDESAGGVR